MTTTETTAPVKVKRRPWHLLWGLVGVGVAMCLAIWPVWVEDGSWAWGRFWEAVRTFGEAQRRLSWQEMAWAVYWGCGWKMILAFWVGEFLSTIVIQRMRGELREL